MRSSSARRSGSGPARRSGAETTRSAVPPVAAKRIRGIRMLLLDVDGVLTDGGIYYSDSGAEMKRFDIHDGMGIDLLQRAGIEVGILTGRVSGIVERRARELGIKTVKQGFYDKSAGLDAILRERGLRESEVAYVGDDVQDLAVMRRVGWSACPSDAMKDVKAEASYVCANPGGRGAVREAAEAILRALDVKARILAEITRPGVKPSPDRGPSPPPRAPER